MSRTLDPVVSRAPAAPETRADALALDDLLAALPSRIEPIRRSRAFRIRLVFAALALLLVLTVYIALVVVTSYGVWSHFASPGLVDAVHRVFVGPGPYIAFCIAGPILCVFLLKPIFTMRRAEWPSVTLDLLAEPRLFAFVERLCAAQGAKAPRMLRVDTQVNASVSPQHRLLWLFRDDLVLTVGLSLVRSMTLRELTGVLAHELGHFAQGGARRLTYLIHALIAFMQRIVHERDGFDETLIELGRFRVLLDVRITLLFSLFSLFMLGVQAFLWLARGLLKGMAWVGLAASRALLREMEYDADRHQARVVGSETFAAVGTRLAVLAAARQTAESLQQRWWQSGRLVDDLPGLVAIMAERLTARPGLVAEIRQCAMEAKTERFDTHPALRDRLASVTREAKPGAFTLDAPATVLFRDLDGLCRAATLADYNHALTFGVKSARFFPVAEMLYDLEGDPGASERLSRFAHGCPLAACRLVVSPSHIAAPDGIPSREELTRVLDDARRLVLELAPASSEAARRLDEARERYAKLDVALALVQANCQVNPTPFGVPVLDVETALEARRLAAADIQTAQIDLAPFSEALSNRLWAALHLRHVPEVAPALTALAADVGRCDALVATLKGLDAVRTDIDRLRSRLALLHGLLQRAACEPSSSLVTRRVYATDDEVRQMLKTLSVPLDAIPYPYPSANLGTTQRSETPTLGTWLGSFSAASDPVGVYSRGIEIRNQLQRLQDRIVSSLVSLAEHVEAALEG